MNIKIDKTKLAAEIASRAMLYIDLAELSGVSRGTISSINGGKSIHPETARKIAEALNIPMCELIEKRG